MLRDVEEDKLLSEIMSLKQKLETIRRNSRQADVSQLVQESTLHLYSHPPFLSTIFHLRAHMSRIYDVAWTSTDQYLVTVGAEGLLIVWDAHNGLIHNVVDVSIVQPITATASKDVKRVFCGGMCANVVLFTSQHKSDEEGYSSYENALVYEHTGLVNGIMHISDNQMITTSAGLGGVLWDVGRVRMTNRYPHNDCTIESSCLLPASEEETSTFLTGSDDGQIRLWDIRSQKPLATMFESHQSVVNCLVPLPNGINFLSGGEDALIHLYDLRTDVVLMRYFDQQLSYQAHLSETDSMAVSQSEETQLATSSGIADIAVSASGRLAISGSKDAHIYYWDLVQPTRCLHYEIEDGSVMRLAMSHKKSAVALMTWEAKSKLRIMRPRRQ